MGRLEHVFFINLDKDIERASKYKWLPYKRWHAFGREDVPDFIDKKMKSMWNIHRDKHLGRCACFMSHISLLKHIAEKNYDYLNDGITYLGGLFHRKKMMDQTPPRVWTRVGINQKKEDFRILMTMSYIVPTFEIAQIMLAHFNRLERYSAIDIMFNDLPLPIYYQFPACFIEEDTQSTIDMDKKTHSNKFYCSER